MASQACIDAGAPATFDHKDTGANETIDGGLRCYITGDAAAARAPVMLISDIFGIDFPQVREFADRVAAAGFYVVVPDFFDGQPLTFEMMANKTPDLVQNFFGRVDPPMVSNVDKVKAHFKSKGLNGKIGVCGFCWGGTWSLKCAADPAFGVAVLCHPGKVTLEMAQAAQCPVGFFPAATDVDCEPLFQEVKSHPNGGASIHKRYVDQIHGFCAARGSWEDPKVFKAAQEVIEATINLFQML